MSKRKPRSFKIPSTPESAARPGLRNPLFVRQVLLRMGTEHIKALDKLCKVNDTTRRKLVEILISEAYIEWQENSNARITPL